MAKVTIETLQRVVQRLPDPDAYQSPEYRVPLLKQISVMDAYYHQDALETAKIEMLVFRKVRYYPDYDGPHRDWRRQFTWELQL